MEAEAAPLIGGQTKTPIHTLVRVRNNQRRHRQRRREYIESLEKKLKATEQRARNFEIENEWLRQQLSLNIPAEQTQPSTTMARSDTQITTPPAPKNIDENRQTRGKYSWTNPLLAGCDAQCMPVKLQAGLTPTEVQPELEHNYEKAVPVMYSSFSATLLSSTTFSPTCAIDPPKIRTPFTCCSETHSQPKVLEGGYWPSNGGLGLFSHSNALPSSTILCSQAFSIINHQNRRGLSMEVIESWLWPGFIYGDGTAESGCRVDSRLLLELLVYVAEVSDVGTELLEESVALS